MPSTGQTWTTLSEIQNGHRNIFSQSSFDTRILSFCTTPHFAIGQRAFLIQTQSGNVLWDLVGLIDPETISLIRNDFGGGIQAIVISHPHYYTTYVDWYEEFKCPIYIGADDCEWLCRKPRNDGALRLIEGPAGTTHSIVPGMTAIKTGGHFPGSLVLHWENNLFIADSIVTVPVCTSTPSSTSRHDLITHCLTNFTGSLHTSPASNRADQLQLPVVDSEHDSPTARRDPQHLAGHQAFPLQHYVRRF